MRRARWLVPVLLVAALLIPASPTPAQPAPAAAKSIPKAKFTTAAAFDVSPTMRDVAARAAAASPVRSEVPSLADRGPRVAGSGFSGDGAVQARAKAGAAPDIAAPSVSFEGLRGQDN